MSAQVHIIIKSENACFSEGAGAAEVQRIVQSFIDRFDDAAELEESGNLFDINGNKCGWYIVEVNDD